MNYLESSLEVYVNDLSAKLPTPGGGSAAAFCGALASSLNSMVSNFTAGNDKYKEFEQKIVPLLKKSEECTRELLILAQADVEAYSKYRDAMKLPKDSDKEKENQQKALEEATINSAKVPLQVIAVANEVLNIAKELLGNSNPNLISDIGVSAVLAESAIKSAILNVEINLKYIKDIEFKNTAENKIKETIQKSEDLSKQIFEQVRKTI